MTICKCDNGIKFMNNIRGVLMGLELVLKRGNSIMIEFMNIIRGQIDTGDTGYRCRIRNVTLFQQLAN